MEAETAVFADDFAKWKEAEERFVSGLQMLDNSQYVALTSLQKLNARHGGRCAFVGYPVEDPASISRLASNCRSVAPSGMASKASWNSWRSVENYVDQEAGACSFDSPGFRSMLEFVSRFPTQKEVEAETAVFADDFAKWKEAEERFVSPAAAR